MLLRRALILFLVLMVSCARGVGTGSDGKIEHPTGSDELVVRVEVTGGLLAPEAQLQTVPSVSILGDGRIFVSGPHIEIYPPPAMVNPLVGKLEEKDVQAILTKAQESGMLEKDTRIKNDRVADASTHVFLINARGQTYQTEAYALLEAETAEGRDVRAFQEFLSTFSDRASEQWEPDRIQVVVFVPPVDSAPDVEPNRIEWPLAPSPEEFGSPYEIAGLQGARCGVAEGVELSKLRAALDQATSITLWSSNAKEFRVAVVPILPDQEGCSVQSP